MSSINSSPCRGQERPCVLVLITFAAYRCSRPLTLRAHRQVQVLTARRQLRRDVLLLASSW